jgi:hypothetical protein
MRELIAAAVQNDGVLVILLSTGGSADTSAMLSRDIEEAVNSFSEQELSKITRLCFCLPALLELPAAFRGLKNLEELDLSYSDIERLPAWIGELRMLKKLRLAGTRIKTLPRSVRRLKSLEELDARFTPFSLPPSSIYLLGALKKALYRRIYRCLDRLQTALDVCGWQECQERRECHRFFRQCCEVEVPCDNLGATGCAVEALSCKLWLCNEALRYLAGVKSDRQNPRHIQALRYTRARSAAAVLCRLFRLPLKIRASLEDSFNPALHDYINTSIPHWYDGVLLYPNGYFPGRPPYFQP